MKFLFLLIGYLYIGCINCNPYKSPDICGKIECKEENAKFNYQLHTNHKYKYSVNVSTLFEDDSKNSSRLQIDAVVNINFLSKCDGILKINQVNLKDNSISLDDEDDENEYNEAKEMHLHASSSMFDDAISEHQLRFAFHDGIISEICPNEEESNWVLNFKRGILSLMHNSMKRFDLDYATESEQDVHGECETNYWVQGPKETSLIIDKTKDLSTCDKRSKLHSMIQTTPYNFRVNYRGKSLLKSASKCSLSIDHRIYNDIECEETHIFEPFSNKVEGAKTVLRQRFTLIDERPEAVGLQDEIMLRTSLLYEHVPSAKPTSDDLKSSRDLMKNLCTVNSDDLQSTFSDMFTKFIHTARQLTYPTLSVLYSRANTICSTGKKHILDALPYLGSSASIVLMKDIILKDDIRKQLAEEWMLTIALNQRPDDTVLESALQLLQQRNNTATVLGISSLVYTYCKQNKECRDNEMVYDIIQLMEEKLMDIYNTGDFYQETELTMITLLKSLGNIGDVSETFKEDLRVMIEDKKLNVAVRVGAVEAHRRLDCEESRPYFEAVFRNKYEESEVRIASYLQVMRCPNYIVVRTVKHCLETEEVNQVGSFVYTHLHNLLKSSIPSRVEIQGLLSDKYLTKKFSTDVRKFSHNFEGSIFFEEYNIGGNYESNVIFSPSSYIPKSLMLNTTVDLFGESINLFEIYGRIDGFEHYIESLFGPKGPYSAQTIYDKIPKMRWGRSITDDQALQSEVNKLPYKMENEFDTPSIALGMKIFGNDLKYVTYNGERAIIDAMNNLNPMVHLQRILSGKEINYNKAAMFLDTTYVVSSGAGLPINLNVVGTTSINMLLKGSLKADNFMKTKELDLTGDIKPNIALDIVGTLSTDAYYTATAIKLKTSMHSSSAIEGHVKVRGAKLITVKFGIPKNVTEVFGVKSELILVKGSLEEAQSGVNKNKVAHNICSPSAVEKTIGFKVCADYYFTNVTEMKNMPYFILAGPAGFKIAMEKSDPSAKTYLMEYKWTNAPNVSYVSLTFDTPGSNIRRVLGANLTIDKETKNLTLCLESTEGTVNAHGKYKNTDAEKYLQIGLNINNVKNFETELSLVNKTIRNGHLYEPKFYLGVNDDRVAELYGSVKMITKLSISQYDVDLHFKTKRLSSKLFGYISKTNASVSSTLKLDYKFVNTKEHHILIDCSLADRSSRNIFIIHGDAKVNTTAYPNYNFNSSLTLQKSGAHIESKFILNSSPHLMEKLDYDEKMLTIHGYLTYRGFTNGTRFKVSASMKRQSTDLDVKGQLSYDQIGYSTNAMVLGRYAKGKDLIVTVYWNHPRQTLENIEGRLNVTIPSFTPMILEGKLKEKNSGGYMIELGCIWFSGHKIDVKGLYQDRSTNLAANHHLKLLIRSPTFDEINADCYYFRNNTEFKIDIKADQTTNEYALYLKHSTSKVSEILSIAKLKYKARLYSVNSFISLKDRRELSVDVHIDSLRDIYLSMWTNNKELYKEAGIEIKWDANRDPNQKLVFTVYYSNPKAYHHDANLIITYPGRTIKGIFNFLIETGHFGSYAGVAWSPDDSFSARLGADYKLEDEISITIHSELLTPFEDWKRTSLNGGFQHKENMYRLNSSAYWQSNQHLMIDLFGDYDINDLQLSCELMGNLDSTIEDIPSISAHVKHTHNSTSIDSELDMTYQPKQKIAITSSWKIDEDTAMKNLTGTVTLISPFKGFNKGLLVSKIYYTNTKELRGIANMDLDHKEYCATVDGHFQRLSKSMLKFNITTPIEKFKLISGRFGFSEELKHLVAIVTYPAGKTGIEIKFLIDSLSKFDTKFNLGTPMEFLKEVLVIGKLQDEMAEFKVGWNSLLAGFSGVWHYSNITDFEYSYKIYTPIEDFEENGITAKLIYKDGLEFETSLKFEETKLGVVMVGHPKPKILKEFGIKTQKLYNNKLNIDTDNIFIEIEESEEDSDEDEEEDEDEEDPFNWTGLVEIYTIIYSPITADIDIDQKGTVYDIVATMKLPMGEANLRSEFDFYDLFRMKNKLTINTPFPQFKQITSNYNFRLSMGSLYLLAFDVNYLNQTQWVKTGILGLYTTNEKLSSTKYNATFHVHTPFSRLPRMDLKGFLHMSKTQYKTEFLLLTNTSDIYVNGHLEMFEQFIDLRGTSHIITPILTFPESNVSFTKMSRGEENKINAHYIMVNNKTNELKLDTTWRYKSLKNAMITLYLATPFQGLEESQIGVEVFAEESIALAKVNLQLFPVALNLESTINDNDLKSDVTLNFNGKRTHIYFNGTVSKISEGKQNINGVVYINDKSHNVSASLEMDELKQLPTKLSMTMHSGKPLTFTYVLIPEDTGYLINAKLQQAEKFAHLNARTIISDKQSLDLKLQIETSHPIFKTFKVNALGDYGDKNKSVSVFAVTPFENLQHIKVDAFYAILDDEKQVSGFYQLGDTGGGLRSKWTWKLLENMKLNFFGKYYKPNYKKEATVDGFYINLKKKFTSLNVGGFVDFNKAWQMGSNLTVDRTVTPTLIVANVLLPEPHIELHKIVCKLNSTGDYSYIDYFANYETMYNKSNYGSTGKINYRNLKEMEADIALNWNNKNVRKYLNVHELDDTLYVLYKLKTPKFEPNDALIANVTYAKWTDFHNVTSEIFYPGNRSVLSTNVNFKEFANMNGFANVTTPFKNFTNVMLKFATETSATVYNRYIQLYWPKDTALLNSTCITTLLEGSAINKETKGLLVVEIPLTTKHIGEIDYNYTQKDLLTSGFGVVTYNNEHIVEATYKCLSEVHAGKDKDNIHVELENKMFPLGADYIHTFEYNAPGDGMNLPTTDGKHLKVYNLHNHSAFHVEGNLEIVKRESGQEIKIEALHLNRTVKFLTDYDIFDQIFNQSSKLILGDEAWLYYHINIVNKTIDDFSEAQQIQIDLSYPNRNFTTLAAYNLSTGSLSSDLLINWDSEGVERKTMQGGFNWNQNPLNANHHNLKLELNHPSLEKNVSILGSINRFDRTLLAINLTVDYSPREDQLLEVQGLVENHSNQSMLNYTYALWTSHPATNLQLDVKGGINYKSKWFYSYHLVDYKRSYLPLQVGEATTRIDLEHNEIEFKRDTLHELLYFWGKSGGMYPLYTANLTAIQGKEINATGEFYLNFDEKLVKFDFNKTEDGSQSLHMYGYIPDARSAHFDIWREYEEDKISDIAYILKMNHSRLIVSSLRWRPELRKDVKEGIRVASIGFYNYTMERADYWRQYIRSEMINSINDVWIDAQPLMENVIEDLRDLKVIEDDLDRLKIFLNNSYNSNEFYIKDVTNFLAKTIDELAIKKHIESLPAIFSEIWEVMGESGKKIQKGIAWVIDKIKSYYKNAAEFINGLFQGDSMEHLSDGLKKLVEKYDNFIKDLHVSFIRYMEELWEQTYKMLQDNWHKTLAAIEPSFIKLAHYVETVMWSASKEVLDFLYMRNSEIMENPYFNKISNFTHDIDKFYKDMTGNDTLGQVVKYTKKAWVFLKEKYFKLVPFGKELQEIVNEILNEVYELRKLPSMQYLISKYNQLEDKVKWFCNYFDVENKIHEFITLVHLKLTDMSQTALEAENKYRHAKTKFVFEPSDGIMHLEQKLPMSWHAFNETPKFEEIPEYKTINSIQNYFSMSKLSFANFYYDYKPYTDPSDWLPPFKAQALLVGAQSYITFDRKVYNFQGGCSYLLASDFLNKNFSIVVSYKGETKLPELLILINGTLIEIDIFNNKVIVGNNPLTKLPMEVSESYLYQEADIVTLESKYGFELQCNMKYHVCTFEVAGWYFGKTAGLWGTVNNEQYDDLITSDNIILNDTDIDKFTESWALDSECANTKNIARNLLDTPVNVLDLCESFFTSNVSPFYSCFDRVSNLPFYDMCLNGLSEKDACSAAVAYMRLCSYVNTPLRIPDDCVTCNLVNGTEVPEGKFVSLKLSNVPQSTDVVFIIEAKDCNKNIKEKLKIAELIHKLEVELNNINNTDNRYSVVLFGGQGVYSNPRSIVINSTTFTDYNSILSYVENIPTGNGSFDIYKAITFATGLIFRPGVSKTFILIPCSDCKESNMRLDYTIMHQVLLENDIALHILMHDKLQFKRNRITKNKLSFGIDRDLAYTKKDITKLIGDRGLRKSIQLPKVLLGYCLPLALETNGSVFNVKKSESMTVFAKRVAQSAIPASCKTCECTAHNSGVSFMECFPCTYPTPMTDFDFSDESLSLLMDEDDE